MNVRILFFMKTESPAMLVFSKYYLFIFSILRKIFLLTMIRFFLSFYHKFVMNYILFTVFHATMYL